MRPLPLLGLALLPALAVAEAPLGTVDRSIAPALHQKACVACHTRMFGGDGSRIYTREDRLLNSRPELLRRVAFCNARVGAGWFPDEEGAVAAWLNDQYYHFKE